MKNFFSALLVVIFFSSCCSTKIEDDFVDSSEKHYLKSGNHISAYEHDVHYFNKNSKDQGSFAKGLKTGFDPDSILLSGSTKEDLNDDLISSAYFKDITMETNITEKDENSCTVETITNAKIAQVIKKEKSKKTSKGHKTGNIFSWIMGLWIMLCSY